METPTVESTVLVCHSMCRSTSLVLSKEILNYEGIQGYIDEDDIAKSNYLIYGKNNPTYGLVDENGNLVEEKTSLSEISPDSCRITDQMQAMVLDSGKPIDTSNNGESSQTSSEQPEQRLKICNVFHLYCHLDTREKSEVCSSIIHFIEEAAESTKEDLYQSSKFEREVSICSTMELHVGWILLNKDPSAQGKEQLEKIKEQITSRKNNLITMLQAETIKKHHSGKPTTNTSSRGITKSVRRNR
ncbi:hypothetical protein COEREDRAFT_89877 [Coemansia reversa NRRL 1564]|uniref:Uncharacterized protein n=1 Tax=Coemansia reversa (strain ATCC 12441 / NRRL 1564) TaxID=763665 RepID=A0A2G5B1Y9_COERN|nr:hypothetical protein COEREDRAFT_89877 [Coemansia reversa NRRL 1564]|eukprot:PIA13032.1 hypothetical protein COEREDRAFT_89877 [Coemansia reversa NRRL 1564]